MTEPVVTSYPHDRLSRLAAVMAGAMDGVPGTGDVRAVILLNDADNGCTLPHNYPGLTAKGGPTAELFSDLAVRLTELAAVLGVHVQVIIGGRPLVARPSGGNTSVS